MGSFQRESQGSARRLGKGTRSREPSLPMNTLPTRVQRAKGSNSSSPLRNSNCPRLRLGLCSLVRLRSLVRPEFLSTCSPRIPYLVHPQHYCPTYRYYTHNVCCNDRCMKVAETPFNQMDYFWNVSLLATFRLLRTDGLGCPRPILKIQVHAGARCRGGRSGDRAKWERKGGREGKRDWMGGGPGQG